LTWCPSRVGLPACLLLGFGLLELDQGMGDGEQQPECQVGAA
jgi:hypothetical protein